MQINGVEISALHRFPDNSITAECNSVRLERTEGDVDAFEFFIFVLTHSNPETLSKHLQDKKQREESVPI